MKISPSPRGDDVQHHRRRAGGGHVGHVHALLAKRRSAGKCRGKNWAMNMEYGYRSHEIYYIYMYIHLFIYLFIYLFTCVHIGSKR